MSPKKKGNSTRRRKKREKEREWSIDVVPLLNIASKSRSGPYPLLLQPSTPMPPPTQLRVTSFSFFQPHQPSGWAERRITTARFPGRQRKSLEKRRWKARGEGREREWERERDKKWWRWAREEKTLVASFFYPWSW